MKGMINGISFENLDAEKYWTWPKSYKGDKNEETRQMFLNHNYVASEKKDGFYSRLIKDEDGNIILQGRSRSVSGEYLDKHTYVPQLNSFFESLPKGTCLLGEIYFPNQPGSRKVTTILGCLESKALARQETGEKLHYYIFDIWAYNGKSYLNTKVENRIKDIELLPSSDYVEKATYLEGEEAWNELNNILKNGGEGMVLTAKGTIPSPGKRPARKTLKVKKEINQTIDAFLTGNYKPATREYNGTKGIENWGYWENIRTGEKTNECKFLDYTSGGPWEPVSKAYYNGWATSIEVGVYSGNKIIPIGYISGITDEVKEGIIKKNEIYKGKVVEISAMMVEHIGNNYSLRHGKIINWRTDKDAKDCTFDQITG